MTRRLRADNSGVAAVEFAMIVLPLLTLLFGAIEFGRLFWTRNALQETAAIAARCMAVRQSACSTAGNIDTAKAIAYTRATALSFSVAVPAAAVVIGTSVACANRPGFVRVSISTTFRSTVPFARVVLGDALALSTIACFPNQS